MENTEWEGQGEVYFYVGPCGTSIDYELTHMGFMESHKLSSFTGR
jgi:hypothetical protein